jgi:hydrogenase expression/formation protein HypC
MCVALPGIVREIEGDTAKVDFKGNIIKVFLGLVDAKRGDYILVHAGCAIEIMKKDSAEELMEILEELEANFYDRDSKDN